MHLSKLGEVKSSNVCVLNALTWKDRRMGQPKVTPVLSRVFWTFRCSVKQLAMAIFTVPHDNITDQRERERERENPKDWRGFCIWSIKGDNGHILLLINDWRFLKIIWLLYLRLRSATERGTVTWPEPVPSRGRRIHNTHLVYTHFTS